MTSPTDLPLFSARALESDGRPHARALAGLSDDPTPAPVATTAPAPAPSPSPPAAPTQPPQDEPQEPSSASPATPVPDREHSSAAESVFDSAAVRAVRAAVTESYRTRTGGAGRLDEHHDGPLIAEIIDAEVRDFNVRRIDLGNEGLTPAQRRDLAAQVRHALFGLGRFAPLLERENLTDIEVEGHDRVVLKFRNGRIEEGPPVADSDDQLIEDIAHLARTNPTGEKDFSPATKKLRMALPDGSRLSAEAWLTPRPSVHIRTHKLIDTTLEESIALGVIDTGLSQFLSATFAIGKNIAIAGPPFGGKTTLSRAILNSLPNTVRIATIESQYELLLHEMPKERHLRVWAAEAQEGGEIRADGSAIGAYTNADLIGLALQKNADRLVVGEVTSGPEALAMIQAMMTSKGSLATIHARTAFQTIDRLATLVQLGATNIDSPSARALVAQNIDVIVHIDTVDETAIGGQFHRYVDEVIAIDNSPEPGGIEVIELWQPGHDGRAAPTGDRPKWFAQLQRAGFDPTLLEAGRTNYAKPLDLKIPATVAS